jgi:hypothetical protein
MQLRVFGAYDCSFASLLGDVSCHSSFHASTAHHIPMQFVHVACLKVVIASGCNSRIQLCHDMQQLAAAAG